MAGAKWKKLLLLSITACLLSGCALPDGGRGITGKFLADFQDTESDAEEMETLLKLPGMTDKETQALLGEGKENWTEGRSFYIGRIYQMELYGTDCQVFTACNADRVVETVSVWIVNGERDVTEEETKQWTERISEVMDAKPFCIYEAVESGARSFKWKQDETAAGMYRMKDILMVSFRSAVGEPQ